MVDEEKEKGRTKNGLSRLVTKMLPIALSQENKIEKKKREREDGQKIAGMFLKRENEKRSNDVNNCCVPLL